MKKLNPVGPYPSPFLHKFVPFVYICSGLCWNIVINQEDGIEEKKRFYLFFFNVFFCGSWGTERQRCMRITGIRGMTL